MSHREPLEWVLFLLGGTITLVGVLLAVVVSPWFLMLAAFVGVSQWSFAALGDCPSSLIPRKLGLKGCAR